MRALLAEIRGAQSRAADTLCFGGGTPSLLAPERILRLAEVTLEANPTDLGPAGYRALRTAGINRLSLGVQSLDDAVLRDMGRLHSAADACSAVEQARGAGIENISVDLILGWPGEDRDRWQRTLRGAVAWIRST